MPAKGIELKVCEDFESLSRCAAEKFIAQAQKACDEKGRFSICLSGGGTPRRTYELLAADAYRSKVDWSRVHVFWGDERCVPSNDDRNNAKMARKAWLDQVPIPSEQIHAIDGATDPHQSAVSYEHTLREFFRDEPNTFDLNLLGLGENGHTASLFPGTAVLDETERWVAETFVAEQDMNRITLTVPVLNRAVLTVFLVSGAAKAQVLKDVLEGPSQPSVLPAQLICPTDGQLLWLVDRPAAANLTTSAS